MSSPLLLVFYDIGLGGVQTKLIDIINYFASSHPATPIHVVLRNRGTFSRLSRIRHPQMVVHTYSDDVVLFRGPFFFTLYVLYVIYTVHPRSILGFLSPFALPTLLTKVLFFWRRTRIIVNEDNYTSGVIPLYKNRVLNELGIRYLYPLADGIIVPTDAVKKDLVSSFGVQESKIVIIPNWTHVHISKMRHNRPAYDLLYAGRLDKMKRVHVLIRAVSIIREQMPRVSFHVFGSGTHEVSLRRLVRSYHLSENVVFSSPVYTVHRLLEQTRIYIFSSQKKGEGFPFALLEAMAHGVPVVTYDFAGVRETFSHGSNGYIYHTSAELARYCIELLHNPRMRRKFAERARETVKVQHSQKNIRLYAEMLGFE